MLRTFRRDGKSTLYDAVSQAVEVSADGQTLTVTVQGDSVYGAICEETETAYINGLLKEFGLRLKVARADQDEVVKRERIRILTELSGGRLIIK